MIFTIYQEKFTPLPRFPGEHQYFKVEFFPLGKIVADNATAAIREAKDRGFKTPIIAAAPN